MRRRTRWIAAAAAALAGAATLAAPVVHGEVSAAELAVADAFGYATPVGTVFRIPNQLDGGALLTTSSLSLDKSQAVAAGYTPGELGEAFLRTTVVAPEGTPPELAEQVSYTNPSLVTAQTPPSEVFPAEASVAGGGVRHEGIRAASLAAATTERSASAEAIGGIAADAAGSLSFRSAGSRTDSEILDDGTVVSRSHAFVTDLVVGDGLVSIGAIDSTAEVAVRPGAEPVHDLDIAISGARIADVPVVIDQDGIRVQDRGLVSHVELQAVNEALAALADQGFTITAFPGIVEETDDRSATVAGAALSIRGDLTDYVPTAVDTPLGPKGSPLGDVGTDDEVLVGRVEASAFAAERGPAPAFLSSSPTPPLPAVPAAPAAVSEPAPAPRASAPRDGASAPVPAAAEAAELAAPADGPLQLVRRQALPGVSELRSAYLGVLLTALAGVVLFLVRRRAHLI